MQTLAMKKYISFSIVFKYSIVVYYCMINKHLIKLSTHNL